MVSKRRVSSKRLFISDILVVGEGEIEVQFHRIEKRLPDGSLDLAYEPKPLRIRTDHFPNTEHDLGGIADALFIYLYEGHFYFPLNEDLCGELARVMRHRWIMALWNNPKSTDGLATLFTSAPKGVLEGGYASYSRTIYDRFVKGGVGKEWGVDETRNFMLCLLRQEKIFYKTGQLQIKDNWPVVRAIYIEPADFSVKSVLKFKTTGVVSFPNDFEKLIEKHEPRTGYIGQPGVYSFGQALLLSSVLADKVRKHKEYTSYALVELIDGRLNHQCTIAVDKVLFDLVGDKFPSLSNESNLKLSK